MVGYGNSITGDFASISGGRDNVASGDFSAVSEKIGVPKKSLIRKYLDFVKISPVNTTLDKSKNINIDDKKTKTKRLKGGGVSVPFMITREMFRELIA